jgi:hypothetical protein
LPLLLPFFSHPENRHFDRSCSRSHRKQRSGENPLLHLSSHLATNVVAVVFLVVISEGDLLLLVMLLVMLSEAKNPGTFIFRVFRPKNACQAPKPSNSLPVNNIQLAY